jgi:hypothetical protein
MDIENIVKTSKTSRKKKEKIAMQHTIESAISSEFQNFSLNEKIALVSAIYIAFVEAFNTGKPICPSINYRITPEIYNEFLAHLHTTDNEHISTPPKVLTLKEINSGVEKIFEREINYHEYIGKSLIICKARIIPSFKIKFTDKTMRESSAIDVNICIVIVRELNKILVESKGSLSTALKLTNQLLNNVQPPIKDIS